ncbi:MAG: hypothetical protein JKX84_03380, partial [Flavobacteriales bacterium]|nr:hypothetical protein [Flavobacteriales bacterium]
IKFNFGPFSWRSGVTLIIGAVAYFSSTLIPVQDNLFLDIFFRSAMIVTVYVPALLALKLSDDVNSLFIAVWEKVKK